MMTRNFSRRCICLSALAVCGGAAVSPASNAQVTASASQPEIAKTSFGAPAEKLNLVGIPRAGKVSDVLYRGAQPSTEGLAELKKLGITTVVDLRGNRGPVASERRLVESLGMRFIDIPVPGSSPPTNAQVAEFLALFKNDPQQKIFVHCYLGEDRSGVMVAAYRIAQQNWTVDQAFAEMLSFGFHNHLYPGMHSYVRKFPANFYAEPVFAPLRPTNANAQP